jgi:hypothetical protein
MLLMIACGGITATDAITKANRSDTFVLTQPTIRLHLVLVQSFVIVLVVTDGSVCMLGEK